MATKTLVHEVAFATIPFVSGGDADVNTKDGRITEVQLEVTNMALSANGESVVGRVLYCITETRPDHTSLALETEIRIPVPNNLQVKGIANASDFRRQWIVAGKSHNAIVLRPNIANSCLESARYQIDGKGRDDQGNASLVLVLSIDLEVA